MMWFNIKSETFIQLAIGTRILTRTQITAEATLFLVHAAK